MLWALRGLNNVYKVVSLTSNPRWSFVCVSLQPNKQKVCFHTGRLCQNMQCLIWGLPQTELWGVWGYGSVLSSICLISQGFYMTRYCGDLTEWNLPWLDWLNSSQKRVQLWCLTKKHHSRTSRGLKFMCCCNYNVLKTGQKLCVCVCVRVCILMFLKGQHGVAVAMAMATDPALILSVGSI